MNVSDLVLLAVNLFLLSSGVLLLLIALVLTALRVSSVRRLVVLGLFLFSCGLWFLVRNPAFLTWSGEPEFLGHVDVFCQYGITLFSLSYVRQFVEGWREKLMKYCWLWTVGFVAVVMLVHMIGKRPFEDFMPLGASCNVLFIALMCLCIGWEAIGCKNRETYKLLISGAPILVSGGLEVISFLSGGHLPTTGFFFASFVFFMLSQLFWFVRHLQETLQRAAHMEQELTNARIALMLSQIRPHFLFNALEGIGQLCAIDPPRAEKAVVEFSMFLRGNLDALTNTSTISFEQELNHTKYYLELEQMRFGQRLRVVLDTPVTYFRMPPLTLQPLAENAVRHGITKKREGGTLTIRTAETPDAFLVTVSDDGIGFDPQEPPKGDGAHLGMENVRARLESQCGGTVVVRSVLGEGTEAVITLPKSGGGLSPSKKNSLFANAASKQ